MSYHVLRRKHGDVFRTVGSDYFEMQTLASKAAARFSTLAPLTRAGPDRLITINYYYELLLIIIIDRLWMI